MSLKIREGDPAVFKVKPKHRFVTSFFMLIFIVMMAGGTLIGISYFEDTMRTIILASGGGFTFLFIVIWLNSVRVRKLFELYPSSREIKAKKDLIKINKGSKVVLRRTFVKVVTTTTRTQGTSYGGTTSSTSTSTSIHGDWEIFIATGSDMLQVMRFRDKITAVWIAQAAEEIARKMNMILVDQTTLHSFEKKPNILDKPLVKALREQKISKINPSDLNNAMFPIKSLGNGYQIRAYRRGFFGSLGFFILGIFMIGLGVVFSQIFDNLGTGTSFGRIFLGFFAFMGILLWNYMGHRSFITISSGRISQKNRGLFIGKNAWKMPLDEIEHLEMVDFFGKRMLEFISDRDRHIFPASLDHNDVVALKKILEKMMISV